MRTNNLYRLFIAVSSTLVVLALAFATTSIIPVVDRAFATAPTPAWWVDNNGSFSQYDDYQYVNGRTHQGTYYQGTAAQLSPTPGVDSFHLDTNASYDGVAAVGPRWGDQGVSDIYTYFTTDANASQEDEWQCTELVKRFLYLEYGTKSIAAYGNQVVDNYTSATLGYPSQFYKIPNDGTAKLYPKPGDVLSYGTSTPGHTALVQSVGGEGSGSATVTLLEQNASSTGLTYQNFQNWQFQNGIDNDPNNTNTVSGWLTPLGWNNNNPSGTNHDIINGMAASSATSAWAAGNLTGVCGTNEPVTYQYNGLGWTRYLIPYNCASYPYNLAGIVTSSPSDAWSVGSYYPSGGQTLAYHWTCSSGCSGSSWTQVTSDNPDGTTSTKRNQLLAVTLDSSGTPWAAGSYGGNGDYQTQLVEKWNGTKFAQQTLPTLSLPIPVSVLNGISFSSSSHGWAVGQAQWWASGWQSGYLIENYNSGTWSATVGASSSGNLKSVAAVSDTEAWAVGSHSNGTPLILHTTNGGSTWSEDTSFNGSYPSGASIQSVSADSAFDVWIVGSSGSNPNYSPYSMHYNGSAWKQVTMSTSTGLLFPQSVAVNSGTAWAGGYSGSSSTPYPLTYKSL